MRTRSRTKQRRKGTLREKTKMQPIPKVAREVWYEDKQPVVEIPSGYRKKWSDEDTERVIRATPEEFGSYEELASALDAPRTPGGVRWRKSLVIHLLNREDYAVEKAQSGLPKNHDWLQTHRVLEAKGFYQLPVSEQMNLARHLKTPSSAWRGDGTQAVLRDRKLNKLDTPKAVKELIRQKLVAQGQQSG